MSGNVTANIDTCFFHHFHSLGIDTSCGVSSSRINFKRSIERLQKAVYGNLKLMKEALTADQYRKYVILLNVTNNNNRLTGAVTFTDIYLAENK